MKSVTGLSYMFTSASCCVCVVCVSSNVFRVSSTSSAGCVDGDGFNPDVCVSDGFDPDVCVGDVFGVDVCVGDGFGVGFCVGGVGELSLESLMEGFSFVITTDCFSAEAFSFGRKKFEFLFMRC